MKDTEVIENLNTLDTHLHNIQFERDLVEGDIYLTPLGDHHWKFKSASVVQCISFCAGWHSRIVDENIRIMKAEVETTRENLGLSG